MNFQKKPKFILNIDKFEKKVNLPIELSQPILFYLEKESHPFLHTFVKIENDRLVYYKTYNEDNIKIVDENGLSHSSHSSMSIGDNGFYNFLALNPLFPRDIFRFVDMKELKMYVFSASEVFGESYDYVSETSGFDNKPNHFLISVGRKGNDRHEIYSCSFDLGDIEKLTEVVGHKYPPHDVKSYGNKIFSTEFFDQRTSTKDGRVFCDFVELEDYIFNSGSLESKIANQIPPYKVFNIDKFSIKPMDGEIFVYDKKSGKSNLIKAGFTPSHIEFMGSNMYISSHNFLFLKNRMVYLGPAAIDLFQIEGDSVIRKERFSDEKGYRFTSHKVYVKNGHPYIVTIGHPNRLFIIDGITMEKYKQIDLGGDILSPVEDMYNYLNEMDFITHYHPMRYSTMEVSDDGSYMILWNQENILFMNTDTYEVEKRIPFNVDGFYQKTYHSERL